MAAKGARIPERVLDAPSQRLYVLSFALALQALKIFSFLGSLIEGPSAKYFLKWMLYDTTFLLLLRFLRIPRLTFRWQSILLQSILLGFVNWLLFGNYTMSFSAASVVPAMVYSAWQRLRGDYVGVDGYSVSFSDLFRGDKHLLGEHTVKLSPISTAKLNPYLESFCIPNHIGHTYIPILFNNTDPTQITYRLTELNDPNSRPLHIVKKKDILLRVDSHESSIPVSFGDDSEESAALSEDEAFEIEFGEYDGPKGVKGSQSPQKAVTDTYPPLQKTQRLRWLKLTRPGILSLETVLDGKTDVRLRQVNTTVVHCPTARFEGPEELKVRCIEASEKLKMRVFGVPPLHLQWQRDLHGKTEEFSVEGIDGSDGTQAIKEGGQTLIARELDIPLTLSLDDLGEHVYSLNSVTDGLKNKVNLFPTTTRSKKDMTRTISVLRPAEFSFKGCRAGQTINLLQGRQTDLQVTVANYDERDGPWKVSIAYTPPPSSSDGKSGSKGSQQGWRKDVVGNERNIKLQAESPGEYRIVGARGQVCAGDILSPEVCRVVDVPVPKAEIEWRMLHECSGDVGVTANLVLHGTPPFRVYYTTKHNNGQEATNMTTINGSRGEITLQPERSGSYVYTFTSLSDANYQNIKLGGPVIKQTVHPLASAMFVGTRPAQGKSVGKSRETTVESCSGDVVDVPVELKGTAPWNLELQLVSPAGTETTRVTGITNNQHTLKLKIPKDIDRDGGTILVDLISVEDANGCKRSLSVPGISVNVRRVKPTAKFYAKDGKREVTVLQGEIAHLPLRLTGDGPWVVGYKHKEHGHRTKRERIRSPNDALRVDSPGTYEIVEIDDAQCPGVVVTPEHIYQVHWTPRPVIRVADHSRVTQATNSSFIRAPVCMGQEDSIDLDIKGVAPYQVTYSITREKEKADHVAFTSLQDIHRVGLRTTHPGRIHYQVTAIGDSRYPLNDDRAAPDARELLHFEQQILARPMAYFKTASRLSYCLNDVFKPKPEFLANYDGMVVFEGKPPFVVNFSIKNLASSEVKHEMMEFNKREWHLDFPDYIFSTVGSYLITIDSVHDASNCDELVPDVAQRSVWVDVAETAMIVPFERRTDVCVGDLLQFQLEGITPWTITYNFNNKIQKTVQKTPKYVTVANVPGNFSVVSIAHQQAQCQTSISDVRLRVHDIPSAQVHHGTRYEENIKEGEQAEIVFTLVGEPPFTFTYQRTELAQYAKGRKPKVLETHTVAGVMSSEYSIFSSAEGTWTVTFISDKWCRYPPAKTDPTIEVV